MNDLQKFVAQASDTYFGKYEVAKYVEEKNNYVALSGEIFQTLKDAEERARELNSEEKVNRK